MEDTAKQEVVTSKDDIDNIENFHSHFGIPIPKGLQEQIDIWKANPESYTWQNQEDLRVEVSNSIITCEHDVMKNDVWKGIKVNCDETYYNAQFDKDLESVLTEDK